MLVPNDYKIPARHSGYICLWFAALEGFMWRSIPLAQILSIDADLYLHGTRLQEAVRHSWEVASGGSMDWSGLPLYSGTFRRILRYNSTA